MNPLRNPNINGLLAQINSRDSGDKMRLFVLLIWAFLIHQNASAGQKNISSMEFASTVRYSSIMGKESAFLKLVCDMGKCALTKISFLCQKDGSIVPGISTWSGAELSVMSDGRNIIARTEHSPMEVITVNIGYELGGGKPQLTRYRSITGTISKFGQKAEPFQSYPETSMTGTHVQMGFDEFFGKCKEVAVPTLYGILEVKLAE